MSPTTQSAPGAGSPPGVDYAAQYAQYYQQNGADPYAAYGGYQSYVAYYQQYMVAAAAAQQQSAPGSVPPPPPNEAPPPPPGSGPPGSNGYNAVSIILRYSLYSADQD